MFDTYIAHKTGSPDYHQVYKFKEDTEEGVVYALVPEKAHIIYKTRDAALAAIKELENANA